MIRIPLELNEQSGKALEAALEDVQRCRSAHIAAHDARFVFSCYLQSVAHLGAQLIAGDIYQPYEVAAQIADSMADALTLDVAAPTVDRTDSKVIQNG